MRNENEGADQVRIRIASPSDATSLLGVYAYYVEHTAITFEYEVPSVSEFEGRIRHTLEKYPYLIAEKEGEIAGYAYAGPFVGRAAYDWSAEATIYLARDHTGCGIGRRLYEALEESLTAMGIVNLEACIGVPIKEDAYLTRNSVLFHAHMGYRMVGEFERCGYKFGTWYNMAWMEKVLGEHPLIPEPVTPFLLLDQEVLEAIVSHSCK